MGCSRTSQLTKSVKKGSNNTNKWDAQELSLIFPPTSERSNNTNKWDAQEP